jgi:hypothetical protein
MMTYSHKEQLFPLGRILIAPETESLGIDIPRLLRRHQSGDFGCVDQHDADQNLKAIKSGEEIVSKYDVIVGEITIMICVMTETALSYTVIFVLNKEKLKFLNDPEIGNHQEPEGS